MQDYNYIWLEIVYSLPCMLLSMVIMLLPVYFVLRLIYATGRSLAVWFPVYLGICLLIAFFNSQYRPFGFWMLLLEPAAIMLTLWLAKYLFNHFYVEKYYGGYRYYTVSDAACYENCGGQEGDCGSAYIDFEHLLDY